MGASIRSSHIAAGLIEPREKRSNHSQEHVARLLSVPRYADLLDPDGDDIDETCQTGNGSGGERSSLITSGAAWRREMAKWIQDEQDLDSDDSDPEDTIRRPGASRKWLPKPLAVLFGGSIKRPVERPPRKKFTPEALLMELLAAEEADEPQMMVH